MLLILWHGEKRKRIRLVEMITDTRHSERTATKL